GGAGRLGAGGAGQQGGGRQAGGEQTESHVRGPSVPERGTRGRAERPRRRPPIASAANRATGVSTACEGRTPLPLRRTGAVRRFAGGLGGALLLSARPRLAARAVYPDS